MSDPAEILYGDDAPKATNAPAVDGKAKPDAAEILYPGADADKPDLDAYGYVKKPDADADKGDAGGKPDVDDGRDDAEGQDDDQDDGDLLDNLDPDLDPEVAGELREVAGELGLDRAGMEKLAAVEMKNRTAYWKRQTADWMADLNREPDLDALAGRANAVVRRFGDAGLGESLGAYGNHPGLIRMLGRIGEELGIEPSQHGDPMEAISRRR